LELHPRKIQTLLLVFDVFSSIFQPLFGGAQFGVALGDFGQQQH